MIADNSSQFPYQVCLIPNLPEETQHQIRDIANHVFGPVNALLAVLSFVCNGLVIITVARTKSLQQPPLLMLCSLAMTDVLFSQYFLLRYIAILAHEYMCPVTSVEIASLFPLCTLATLGNLAVISRDRYLAVRKPWWYRSHVTKSRAIKFICASWLISAVISITMYLSRKFDGRFPPIGQITPLSFYLICFFVIVFSYLGIYCKKTPAEEVLHIRAILEREKRLANTVGLILLVLFLTFLPGLFFVLILHARYISPPPFRPFYSFLLVINGFLNSLLNFGRNREMRRALRNLFKCSHQVQPSSAASAAQQPATATTRAAAM